MRIPSRPPDLDDLLTRKGAEERLQRIREAGALHPTVNGKYRHWDTLRHLEPPGELTHEDWWLGIRLSRESTFRVLPLLDKGGRPFRYSIVDPILQSTSGIDRDASGQIQVSEQVTSPEVRDRYIVSSLIDEAANSSILEGAATTVHRARELIRTGDHPRTRGERMVLNNYLAMRRIRTLTDESLNPEMIFEVHRILTEGILDHPDAAGRLRRSEDPEDTVVVLDATDGTVLHIPPVPAELAERMERMCAFANDVSTDPYVHPVVRAIALHYWLAYDHPFIDGNGRTARALFYWAMLRQGYWLTSFVSISRILRRAPARYARSFLYTETDANDLTYFIVYQLEVLRKAIDELQEYLTRKTRQIRAVERMLRPSAGLNHRQVALLGHAVRHPEGRYTIESHQTSHEVAYQTARTDLLDLDRRGLMVRRKAGRRYVFSPPPDLIERLKTLEG